MMVLESAIKMLVIVKEMSFCKCTLYLDVRAVIFGCKEDPKAGRLSRLLGILHTLYIAFLDDETVFTENGNKQLFSSIFGSLHVFSVLKFFVFIFILLLLYREFT